jgi:hypothetical protein
MFSLFLFYKIREQRAGRNKSFLEGRAGTIGKREMAGKEGTRLNMVQKMCTYTCKCKNDTWRQYS